jgi:hypothetical protein
LRAPNGYRLLASLALSIAAFPAVAGGLAPGMRADAPAPVASRATEAAIASLIRDWFARLAAAPADPRPLELLAREPSLELSLAGGSSRAPEEVEAWLEELRSPHAQVEFAIDSIRIAHEAEGVHRARFEVERRARAADGALLLARWDQTWWVRTPPAGAPSILRIEQRPALPFPGTGPRIVCD